MEPIYYNGKNEEEVLNKASIFMNEIKKIIKEEANND